MSSILPERFRNFPNKKIIEKIDEESIEGSLYSCSQKSSSSAEDNPVDLSKIPLDEQFRRKREQKKQMN